MIKLLILLPFLLSCKEQVHKNTFMLVNQKVLETCQTPKRLKIKTEKAVITINKTIFNNLNNVFLEGNSYNLNFYINQENKTFLNRITFNDKTIKTNNEVRIKRIVGKENEIPLNCDFFILELK